MLQRFSNRTSWDTGESALARAIRERRAAGLPVIDLTVSNPTVCGFEFDSQAILGALADPAAMIYNPDPRGIRSAREAVARYYRDHGAEADPDRLILTTSTSEAYSFLFRLLCDPGDEVLVAQPSYPLFDFLAGLDNVALVSYPLFYDFGWWIDFGELERRVGPRTRAIVLVHPNNPTGHATQQSERRRIEDLCLRHGLALIVDEVFLDYPLVPAAARPGLLEDPLRSFGCGPHPCLTFVVSGLSKIVALPQMKVGWITCWGPGQPLAEALTRLEVIADTFLSMNAPAQHALPVWLAGREPVTAQIRARVRENLTSLARLGTHLTVLPVESGWSAIVRLPFESCGETMVETLVNVAGVVVHPGSFYGFPGHRHLVFSLICPTAEFCRGVELLNRWCEPGGLTPARA